jgi:hypothetical protein
MGDFNLLNLGAGVAAYLVAMAFALGPLVYLAHRFDLALTRKVDEEALLAQRRRSVGIRVGAVLVCQAVLIRHAVPAAMDVLRTPFAYEVPGTETLAMIGRSALFTGFIVVVALSSLKVAGGLFFRLTKIDEDKEIFENDNVAVAIYYALVLFAITLVLNEGMHELARSFVPFGRTGEL